MVDCPVSLFLSQKIIFKAMETSTGASPKTYPLQIGISVSSIKPAPTPKSTQSLQVLNSETFRANSITGLRRPVLLWMQEYLFLGIGLTQKSKIQVNLTLERYLWEWNCLSSVEVVAAYHSSLIRDAWRILTNNAKWAKLDFNMASTINLSLTDELRKFIERNCGDDGLYSTPSEFIRDLLREKKERQEAAALRDGVLEGYRDLLEGRTVEFTGDLKASLQEARLKEKSGW